MSFSYILDGQPFPGLLFYNSPKMIRQQYRECGWTTFSRRPTPRQAAKGEIDDRLIWGAGRQVDLDLRLHLDDARGDLHQAEPQGVELGHPPARAFWSHQSQAPQQPIGPGMEKQAELVGRRPRARGPVSREVGFPSLQLIFRLSPGTIQALVEPSPSAVAQIGENEPGVGTLRSSFDLHDDAADPAPGGPLRRKIP